MSNSFSLCTAAALAALTLNAFELGHEDSTIYAAKGQRTVAEELSGYLVKVFGRSFPVKVIPEEIPHDLAGIFVGVKPPDSDLKWDAERNLWGQAPLAVKVFAAYLQFSAKYETIHASKATNETCVNETAVNETAVSLVEESEMLRSER